MRERVIVVTLSVCLSICLSVCLFVCLSVCLFVCLSVCLFVCLSVCLSVADLEDGRLLVIKYKCFGTQGGLRGMYLVET